jgi:ribosomal protein L27
MSNKSITKKQDEKDIETQQQLRKARGARLFQGGNVCMGEDSFYVQSESHPETVYEVQGRVCNCPDFERRQMDCKHIFSVEFYFLAAGMAVQQ